MTVVRQNILSTIMLKNVKLSYGNLRLHLATPEIFQARNLCSYPRTTKTIQKGHCEKCYIGHGRTKKHIYYNVTAGNLKYFISLINDNKNLINP